MSKSPVGLYVWRVKTRVSMFFNDTFCVLARTQNEARLAARACEDALGPVYDWGGGGKLVPQHQVLSITQHDIVDGMY